ncbi:putative aldouronate transport system permease protein [Paenibacillus sp. 1_12]|uniref:carbohydrate ABC transporter permease n=1 Tax=Paenibacillus sp. 1_12 TaxID=1566278 RepID=UPI0008E0453A|nr:carbohydrate ABC transporter permease [Paenibacillus sp. 1_12]SFL99381.1 putative aldouronate transport system permease protein [Paenibacillus sp. 1_12]
MINRSLGNRVFDTINAVTLFIVGMLTIIPFVLIISGSFAPAEELLKKGVVFFPSRFSFDAYRYIFSTDSLIRSMLVTIYITVVGTLVNLFLTSITAYGLARKDLLGRRPFMLLIIFTLLFNGGIIPTFLVVKSFGLLDSYNSLIIPTAISAFNLIILKNFFQQLPEGLEEAAKIDGCNDFGILFRIVLPLSMPALATFALFYAVGHWNAFFNAILYINDSNKWPIQVLLRQIVIMSQGGIGDSAQFNDQFIVPPAQTVSMAVIVVSTIPILLVYPFLQKHFTKGLLLGSVKG